MTRGEWGPSDLSLLRLERDLANVSEEIQTSETSEGERVYSNFVKSEPQSEVQCVPQQFKIKLILDF